MTLLDNHIDHIHLLIIRLLHIHSQVIESLWLLTNNNVNLADEPDIMPCIMTITIGGISPQQCRCQENYRQCSATHCCNHKTYRSLRADPTTTSATPSAVDLLLEFADRFKKHLETAQQNK